MIYLIARLSQFCYEPIRNVKTTMLPLLGQINHAFIVLQSPVR
jgi:hypothetical protein